MTMEMDSKVVVSPEDRMTDENFARHMDLRHGDSLGGLNYFPRNMSAYVLECYRKFHRQLHVFRADLDHEHGER